MRIATPIKERNVLEWVDIHHRYGNKTVAHGINLAVGASELVAILGPSGSGKSTLLKMAAGLVAPQHGQIRFNGADYTFRQPEQRRFALMFQDYALLPHLNVWQNVAFGLRMQGQSKATARAAAIDILAQVGLAAEAERRTGALSGGEQQRVALARALVTRPQALLLDEPFSALDSHLRSQLQQLTLALLQQQPCPTVMVTHSPTEALQLATRVCLLDHGRWLQQGSPADLLAKPASAAAARLLGCDNVTEQHYIPQAALHLHHPQGSPSTLLAAAPQAGLWRLQWQHPQYGTLQQWLPATTTPPAVGDSVNLWVDAAAVVVFEAT